MMSAAHNKLATIPNFIGEALNYTAVNLLLIALSIGATYFFAIPILPPLWILGITLLITFYISYLAKKQATLANNNALRLTVFGLFVWLGYTLTPYILSFVFFIPNGAMLLLGSAIATFCISITTALYARYIIETQQDKKYVLIQPLLMNILFGLIVISLLNIFLHIPLLMLIESLAGACLFTLFLFCDMINNGNAQRTDMNNVQKEHLTILCGANIALDIANIFISLLDIMAILNSKKSRQSVGASFMNIVKTLVGPLLMLGVVLGINEWFSKDNPMTVAVTKGSPTESHRLSSDKQPSFLGWLFDYSNTPNYLPPMARR